MPTQELKKYGFFSVRDSGVPPHCPDYTTLIILHGSGLHAASFDKLFPLVAAKKNLRFVAANRPDYPGAVPLPDKHRTQLKDITEAASENPELAANSFLDYTREYAQMTHDFLVEFISTESIPINGGIILAGWSISAAFVLGLLANADAISSKHSGVDLGAYMKHVLLYDPPAAMLGYAPPPNLRNPLFDPSLKPDEALRVFPVWMTSYFAHGEDLTKLTSEALDHPPPTILSMDPSDLQCCMEINPFLPGGSDERFITLGVQLGIFTQLKERAIYLDKGGPHAENTWDNVEIKYVWCDQSVWEIPWGVVCLQAELDESKKMGRAVRKIEMVRVRGGNHFYHWDQPELALTGLLSGL